MSTSQCDLGIKKAELNRVTFTNVAALSLSFPKKRNLPPLKLYTKSYDHSTKQCQKTIKSWEHWIFTILWMTKPTPFRMTFTHLETSGYTLKTLWRTPRYLNTFKYLNKLIWKKPTTNSHPRIGMCYFSRFSSTNSRAYIWSTFKLHITSKT